MLDARNIKTTRPTKSLDYKNLGPFKIIRAINHAAYELELPGAMQNIFPVFHPWLLHPVETDPLPGQVEPEPPAVEFPDGDEWNVAEIVDSTIDKRRKDPVTNKKGCLMYKMNFTNSPAWNSKPPWQPFTDVTHSPDIVANYHHKYPKAEGPHTSAKTPEDWEPLLMTLMVPICTSRT